MDENIERLGCLCQRCGLAPAVWVQVGTEVGLCEDCATAPAMRGARVFPVGLDSRRDYLRRRGTNQAGGER